MLSEPIVFHGSMMLLVLNNLQWTNVRKYLHLKGDCGVCYLLNIVTPITTHLTTLPNKVISIWHDCTK